MTTLAGSAGQSGSADGTRSAARFSAPTGVAVDSAGNVYVADLFNYTIRKNTPDGVVTTLAGSAGQSGTKDGTGSVARFFAPVSVAVDSATNVYVADSGNSTIRKITPAGVVTTLAGNTSITNQLGQPVGGYADGTGSAARFHGPQGVAVDSTGNVYVADTFNDTIRKITPAGVVTTLAGLAQFDVNGAPIGGSSDGTGSSARFYLPNGVAVDSAGYIYVADYDNDTIRKITPAGTNWVVRTLAGSAEQEGSADGIGSAARFFAPSSVAVDSTGNVYVADFHNHRIAKGTPLRAQFNTTPGSLTVSNGSFLARLIGPSGGDVVVEASSNLQTWTPIQTNALAPDGLDLSVPLDTNQNQFFRARLAP